MKMSDDDGVETMNSSVMEAKLGIAESLLKVKAAQIEVLEQQIKDLCHYRVVAPCELSVDTMSVITEDTAFRDQPLFHRSGSLNMGSPTSTRRRISSSRLDELRRQRDEKSDGYKVQMARLHCSDDADHESDVAEPVMPPPAPPFSAVEQTPPINERLNDNSQTMEKELTCMSPPRDSQASPPRENFAGLPNGEHTNALQKQTEKLASDLQAAEEKILNLAQESQHTKMLLEQMGRRLEKYGSAASLDMERTQESSSATPGAVNNSRVLNPQASCPDSMGGVSLACYISTDLQSQPSILDPDASIDGTIESFRMENAALNAEVSELRDQLAAAMAAERSQQSPSSLLDTELAESFRHESRMLINQVSQIAVELEASVKDRAATAAHGKGGKEVGTELAMAKLEVDVLAAQVKVLRKQLADQQKPVLWFWADLFKRRDGVDSASVATPNDDQNSDGSPNGWDLLRSSLFGNIDESDSNAPSDRDDDSSKGSAGKRWEFVRASVKDGDVQLRPKPVERNPWKQLTMHFLHLG